MQNNRVNATEVRTININVNNPEVSRINRELNLEKNEFGDEILNFTDEESNSSIEIFGCDCPSSINKLKRLRGLTAGVYGELLTDDVFVATCPHQQTLGT